MRVALCKCKEMRKVYGARMIVDRYYYGRLPENEKQVYKEIYQGCLEHKDVIPLSASHEEIEKSYQRIMEALTDDNPLLYFINQSMLDFATDANGRVAALPQYYFTAENVAKYNQKIQDAANKLINDLKLTEGSDIDKVRKVHDYICANVKYDYDGSDIKNLKSFITSHNIIGVFAHKKAQCEGIAKAVKVLLNAVDMKCIFVTGKAKGLGTEIGDHGWNIVDIEGDPYQLDITYDIAATKDGYISYDYFNITDTQIRKNHVFSTGFPKCTLHEASFFETNDIVFSSKKKLQGYISERIKAGDKMLYFKLSGKLKASEIWEEMMNYGFEILCEMGYGDMKGERVLDNDINTCRIIYK